MTSPVIERDRAIEALWSGLRLVVVDVETTSHARAGTKVVSIGLVTCRAGRIQGQWSSLVNPGVPISRATTAVHGLRDDDVAGAPTMTDLASTIAGVLAPRPGDQLVLGVYNAAFDVPILRAELAAAGHTLSDLPVLDAMGRLKALAGVAPARNSLTSLLAELRIVNANPHDALSDAFATAQATIELLARAATAGHGPLAALLRTVEATTALTQAAGTFAGEPAKRTTSPGLSAVHLRSHSRVLGPTPAPRTLSTWTTSLVECARLRCSHAGDRIATAGPAADVLAVELTTALRTLHAAGDAPGTATVLHAASGLLEAIGDTRTGRHRRRAALTLYDTWTPLVDGITRCGEGHACPACREGRPCGVDTWTYHLAGAAVGAWTLNAVKSFMPVSGAKVRSQESVWGSWTRDGCGSLADAALWRCHEWWTEQGQPGSAASLAQISWEWGARHPRVALAYADAVAAGGRHEDLRVALDITAQTLDHPRKDGPPEHWRTLAARRTLLSAQLARGTARPTGQVDEDGSPIMARRHHPEEPRRSRPSRFLRTSG